MSERLFSYGTLQLPDVQLRLFGRLLYGSSDELEGFTQSMIDVDGGRHPIVTITGNPADRIAGTAYELSDAELEAADRYEPEPYTRISTTLASGKEAWVYADTRRS